MNYRNSKPNSDKKYIDILFVLVLIIIGLIIFLSNSYQSDKTKYIVITANNTANSNDTANINIQEHDTTEIETKPTIMIEPIEEHTETKPDIDIGMNEHTIQSKKCFVMLWTFQKHYFAEAIDSLSHYLIRSGYNLTSAAIEEYIKDPENIELHKFCYIILVDPCTWLGSGNSIPRFTFPKALPPSRTILYNFEPIANGGHGVGATCLQSWHYLDAIQGYVEWDYSKTNVNYLTTLDRNTHWMPPVFDPEFTTWHLFNIPIDIDVIFFGAPCHRRDVIIGRIQKKGIKIHVPNGFGIERDKIIARAKIVLNIHFSNVASFEFMRLMGPLANRRCIVSETISDQAILEDFKDGIIFSPYDSLADTVETTLSLSPEERAEIGEKGYHAFSTLYHPDSIVLPLIQALPPIQSLP